EIILTERQTLSMRLPLDPPLTLHLRPQSFFQTNTEVATALYRQAQRWVDEIAPATVWDLYCGVGGFALACAAPGRSVTGVELSAEAVTSARQSAREAATESMFVAGDATEFAVRAKQAPQLVIVNPPRRGIGPELAGWLEASDVPWVLYSSCNAETMARDLIAMPSLRPVKARLLDMFPHTTHYEVMALLRRG
ncbi:MAG: methyltransferase, partial [Promicromonosporaceae bacterium]|nr:methyltransferase [Promicromonosporaceae bacterium]